MFASIIIQHNEKTTATLEIQTVDDMINIVKDFRGILTNIIQRKEIQKYKYSRSNKTDVNEYCNIGSKYFSQHNT